MASIVSKLKNAWNAFTDPSLSTYYNSYGMRYAVRPDYPRMSFGNEQSIISALYNRVSMDVSAIDIRHVKVDPEDNDQYLSDMDSELNERLHLSANIDQSGRDFIQDVVLTMFDSGSAAIVPVDTDVDPNSSSSYVIKSWRVGPVIEWMPRDVRVRLYNDQIGEKQEITVSKSIAAIVTNPLYSVMNERNSTLQRLIRKLNILDAIDEQSGAGKLDLIIQLPYIIKSDARRKQAEKRRRMIEDQLAGSKYGIAYTDGTERVTQLNRPVENHLLDQIKYLTEQLYGQLGISENIQNGTASDLEMLNYYSRTVEPVIHAITVSMERTFLTKTARSQGQRIKYFRDPFRLVPAKDLADIAAKFTSAEIMSSNEFRSILMRRKSDDPNADALRNANINPVDSGNSGGGGIEDPTDDLQDDQVESSNE